MGFLRLLLALAVAVSHSTSARMQGLILPSDLAVQSFFLISGFYSALILHRKYNFQGGTRLFYQQRYLRLAPMYWVAILGTFIGGLYHHYLGNHPMEKFALWNEQGSHLSAGTLLTLVATQASMFGLDGLMFCKVSGHPLSLHLTSCWSNETLPAVKFMLVPQAWSLSIELLFYTLAPFVVRRSVRFQLSIVAITFGLRIFAAYGFGLVHDPWTNRFFPFEAGLFLLGSLAYQALGPLEIFARHHGSMRAGLTLFFTASIALYKLIPLPEGIRHWGFLGFVFVSVPLLFAATSGSPYDRMIGEISYPLYLLHQIIFSEPILRRTSGLTRDFVILLLPLIAAALAYVLIERPFEAWRARRYSAKRLADQNSRIKPAIDCNPVV